MKKFASYGKTALAVMLFIALAASTMIPSFAAAQPDNRFTADDSAVTVSIYPTPQKTEAGKTEGMSFDGTVDLVIKGDNENGLITNKTVKILEENGIQYREADEADGENAALIISSNPDDYDGEDDALSHEQGYVLVSTDDGNKKGSVTIIGNGVDGAWNGLMTFAQMLDQKTADGKFACVSVYDYPDTMLRGWVEGFYGIPWTNEQRIKMVEDASKYKMNTYVYAPKDDPYHSAHWSEEYPEDKAEEIRELVKVCNENNVTFCWNAHLRTGIAGGGAGTDWADGFSIDTLNAKFESMYELGVRRFGVSYDDIGNGGATVDHGTFHGKIVAESYEALKENHPGEIGSMIVVADRYCYGWGAPMNTYFLSFMNAVPTDTFVMWTGNAVLGVIANASFDLRGEGYFTGNGSGDYLGTVENYPVAWFNYPVNDMEYGRLHIGPLQGVKEKTVNISGLLLNPMTQAEASKVAIYSAADYSWNMDGFDGSMDEGSKNIESWKRAIKELVGEELADSFTRFADNTCGMNQDISVTESVILQPTMDAVDKAIESGENVDEAIMSAKAKFQEMMDDSILLQEKLPTVNSALWAEIEPFVRAYEVLGQAGVATMECYDATVKGDLKTSNEKQTEYRERLVDLRTKFKVTNYTYNRSSTQTTLYVAEVGTMVVKPWLAEIQRQVREMIYEWQQTEPPATDDPVKMGDVNGNGEIDAGDATMILRSAVGMYEMTPEQKEAADMNKNGSVDSGDATLVLRIVVGLA